MKICPFEISTQRLPRRDRELAEMFEKVRSDAKRRLVDVPIERDGRAGFGIVYATGRLRNVGGTLSSWFWRIRDSEHLPERLDAHYFFDDPMGAEAIDPLAVRAAAAVAFADAANAFFDADDGRFHAFPLEVAEASPELPEGFHRRDDADLLSIDLMSGLSNAQVIDRLLEAEHRWDPERMGWMGAGSMLRMLLWHRVDRLNAARAMLRPTLRKVALPGLPALRRRMLAVEETVFGPRGG